MNEKQEKWLYYAIAVVLVLALGFIGYRYPLPEMPDEPLARGYNTNIYTEQGGSKMVVASGGEIEIQSGGTLDVQAGVTTDFSGGVDLDSALLDLDADGDTSIQADTDDQIDIEISGSDVISLTTSYAYLTLMLGRSFTNLTVTDGYILTPTQDIYALDTAAAVTITLGASAEEGQMLMLIGDDANTITIADTNVRTTDGAKATMGQYDVIVWLYQDDEWVHLAKSANE